MPLIEILILGLPEHSSLVSSSHLLDIILITVQLNFLCFLQRDNQ